MQIILEQNIYEKIISNFDRTPVGFTFPNKNIFTDKINESLPVTNVDDKRQVSATFPVSLSGEFLAIELICGGTTDICHPKEYHFPIHFISLTQTAIVQMKKIL